MVASDEPEDPRLAGRTPRVPRSVADEPQPDDDVPADAEEIDTVNRLMGFLRGNE